MSFVTKRERVFNEYKLFDLPARNEGKLKAYSSCTDARAWSHFISDKTEHLFEIIKRNNERCRPKYVPTEVIVDTLMMAKNAQISRLKQRIQEFERMLAAYDQLELNAGQKSEIADAHATIKAANKELNDLYINLDLSGDTEGIDSEAFGTGKSRGDEISRSSVAETAKSSVSEWSYSKEPTPEKSREDHEKIDQGDQSCRAKLCNRVKFCETGTNAVEDSRIEELQDTIVNKDAKLCAMQNTIAVLEHDVCEPYCIYAHIYTALEKIFAILRQNIKYKHYLDLLTLGRDIQHIHIKGKILYKIKILEKFSIALIAPCSQSDKPNYCNCYRAEVLTGYETAYAVSDTESSQTIIDKKRAHLIADIIDVDEIKEAINDQSFPKSESDSASEFFDIDECDIENKSKHLIKSLQLSYSELVTCYENLKSEKDRLYVRCQELLKVKEENESLRNNMKDYNSLWNEMEYFKKRSENLDKLKAKYYLLFNETTNLESKFIAESEKNKIKSDTITELTNETLLLDRKLKELMVVHEKEKNSLIFKLKEIECTNMCQEQQIKSLSNEIERILNQNVRNNDLQIYKILDRIVTEKDQINFKENCYCKIAPLEHLQQEIDKNLEYINELKMEVETWENKYDDAVKYNNTLNDKIKIINNRNQELSQMVIEKTNAQDNLHNIIQNKLIQNEYLNEELEQQRSDNIFLKMEINKIRNSLEPKESLSEENIYRERNRDRHSVDYNCKKKESTLKKDPDIVTHYTKNSSSGGYETVPGYNETMNQDKKVLNIPEKDNVAKNEILLPFHNFTNENLKQYKMKNENQKIDGSTEKVEPKHKYSEDILIEIKETQNFLKGKLSLLENEQHFFVKQNSADIDIEHIFLTQNNEELEDNLGGSETNSIGNDLLSQIKLLRKQSTATIAKCETIKEQYKKSLSLTKKEIADLQNELVKSEHKNYADDTLLKMIQDKCNQNESLMEQLKVKNYEIKKLLMEINKMRKSFEEKIDTLEEEKHKLLHYLEENKSEKDFLSKNNKNNDLNPNEKQSSNLISDPKDIKLSSEESATPFDKYNNVKESYENSIELTKQEISGLKSKELQLTEISRTLEELTSKHNNLLQEKDILKNELYNKSNELSNLMNNCNQVNCLVQELEPYKLKYDLLKTETEKKLSNKEAEINELHKINTSLERNIQFLSTVALEDLKQKINNFEQECDSLKADKEKSNTKLEEKENELKNILENLECIKNENINLLSQINDLRAKDKCTIKRISSLENEIISLQTHIDSLKKDMVEKDGELVNFKNINDKLINLQIYNDELKKANDILQEELNTCKEHIKTLEDDNKVTKMLNHNIVNEIESIKTVLKIKEDEIIRTNHSFKDIKEELEKMKAENHYSNDRVLDLLNKLELCEQIINKLKEDLLERNNTIFELQNHINDLQEEIKKLHESLEIATDNNKKLNQETIEKLDQPAQKVKAHYSKAAHNIKPELAKLKDINESIKLLKLGSKETDIEKEKCVSKINHLENEKKSILYNLNQLAVAVLGCSTLNEKCSTKDIIGVLHNIHKLYEDKNAYYEKQIQNAQSSYQLLRSKTEEAQEIAEAERQKMIDEKESNERDRQIMEKKLLDLNEQLHNKDIIHNDIIKDLEIKLLNQQTLFNQINESQENHIIKLNNEVRNLMDIYEKSLTDVEVLQQKLKDSAAEKNLQNIKIDQLLDNYEKKCTEIEMIQNEMETLKNKSWIDLGVQANFEKANKNVETNNTVINSVTSTTEISSNAVNSQLISIDTSELIICDEDKDSYLKEDSAIENDISTKIINAFESTAKTEYQKSKYQKLQKTTLESYSISTLIPDSNSNHSNLQIVNTDFGNNLDSNVSENKIRLESKNKISYFDKNTQTVSEDNIHIQNRVKVESLKNFAPQNKKYNDDVVSLIYPYKQSSDKEIKDPKIRILTEQLKSKVKEPARHVMPKKIYFPNRYAINKKTVEPRVSAVKNYSPEGTLNGKPHIPIMKKGSNSDHSPQDRLSLHLKVMSLNDLTKQLPHDESQGKHETLYQKSFSLTTIESNKSKIFQNNVVPENKSESHTNLQDKKKSENDYITNLHNYELRRSRSYEQIYEPFREKDKLNLFSSNLVRPIKYTNKDISERLNKFELYEKKIKNLSHALVESEKDHHKKIEAVKQRYENHIKNIINEHNRGVVSIQTLHEETLSDVIKIHDIEIENLRALSIEAMTKSEKLEKENKKLRTKMEIKELDQRPTKLVEVHKKKSKTRMGPSYLTKTDVEAFNVKPKRKSTAPCACAINISVSDVIRNIFEQADAENKKVAEETYLKYITDKLTDGIEKLNPRELSFLHLKVCRIWKTKRKDKTLREEAGTRGQELVSIEHRGEADKGINRRRAQDGRKGMCKILPVEFNGRPSQDRLFSGNRHNKKCCGCVYNVKYEERHAGRARTSGAFAAKPNKSKIDKQQDINACSCSDSPKRKYNPRQSRTPKLNPLE